MDSEVKLQVLFLPLTGFSPPSNFVNIRIQSADFYKRYDCGVAVSLLSINNSVLSGSESHCMHFRGCIGA